MLCWLGEAVEKDLRQSHSKEKKGTMVSMIQVEKEILEGTKVTRL